MYKSEYYSLDIDLQNAHVAKNISTWIEKNKHENEKSWLQISSKNVINN